MYKTNMTLLNSNFENIADNNSELKLIVCPLLTD